MNTLARNCLTLILPALLAGCFQSPPAAPAPPGPAAQATTSHGDAPDADSLTANGILKRLLETYRGAATYQDQGVVKLQFKQGGQPAGDEWPCAVQFARPNKLSLAAFQATVKCDGRQLAATIKDELTANLDGQVLVRPAPPKLALTDLAGDEILYNIITSQLRRQPIQLELLLESGGLAAAFGEDVACKKIADGRADGRDCFRVEVPSPGGSFVFWIDKRDSLLRRLDYPVAALIPELASDPGVTDLRLSAELTGAMIGGTIDDGQFALALPPDAKRMKSLVEPPQPLPSQLFGRDPGEYFFTELGGERMDDAKLSGRIAVLAWYHGDPACAATMQQVSAARARLKDDEAVAFFAVASDPTSASNDQLRERLAQWKVDLPIVRDLEAFGKKAFQIESHPTLVVLDERGRVQIFQVGGNPQLADQIVQIVERLKMGADLAADILAQHQRERRQYDELVARGGPEPGQVFELPEAVIRRRTEPKLLKLQELWTCRDVKSPGNIVLVEAAQQPTRILVIEGWRTIMELGHDGKVMSRHELDLPERAAITFVRPATDKTGRLHLAAAAPLAPQFFLFDQEWKLARTVPADAESPLAITDLTWADVNDDGTPEILAANVGELGLVAAAMDGQIVWRNWAFANATSVAVSRPNDAGSWGIFVTGEQGTVLRVNRHGLEESPRPVGQWPLGRLVAARFAGGKQAKFLGLSTSEKGEPFAVGITEGMKEAWNYPLPAGVHQRPIEAVTSSNLLPGRQGEWWLAGPDGSIHVISEDGEFHDAFHYGAALTGLAATKLGDQSVLLVATEEGVTAWKFD